MEMQHTPEQLVADLVLLLDMEPRGADRFQGRRARGGAGRVFGGQVIAQALAAAELTVCEDRSAHSLHCYFLRGGNRQAAIDYQILRDFDGRSISNRRVTAQQDGNVILNLTASFHCADEGFSHQQVPMPQVTPPEALEEDFVRRRRLAKNGLEFIPVVLSPGPIDWRSVELEDRFASSNCAALKHSWFRAKSRLPDDPRVHRAALAYASDMLLLDTATMPHPVSLGEPSMVASTINHSVWFHAPFRADEWLLFRSESPWAGGARGFIRGSIFSRDGRLVASVAQEGLLRVRADCETRGCTEEQALHSD
ncbi:MAG: acyl-CoA thioesterase II [Novosphingobium sp.]|nr:acyl-CoA thioesterase II [Novosphingobium sp.]MCP5379105.1 acyl-CoA thioesterase II [Novosphingobium sp.]MCP5388901.1 acyl-CoA thioesterase II [Novosphingobium sp.]